MPKVNVNDIEMYYEVHGEGIPLVMINGYSGNIDNWDHLVPIVGTLSKHFKVITLDNRGTGRSSKPEGPYSIKTMADDVALLLDLLEIEKTHVLGASMGGMIAQELALRHKDKVDALVLICTSPGGKAYQISGQREAFEYIRRISSPPPGMSMQEIMEELFSIVYNPKYFEENRDRIMSPSTKYLTVVSTLEKQYDACVSHDTYDRLGSIEGRTLVIHGENDLLLFPEGARILAENIPNASLLMVKEAGHMVPYEKWDELYPEVLVFLS